MNIAIANAQVALQHYQPRLIVDGRWGSMTSATYAAASSELRRQADLALAAAGFSAKQLDTLLLESKRLRDGAYLQEKEEARRQRGATLNQRLADVREPINQAAEKTGMPAHILIKFAELESGLRPTAVNGSSRGLMQFQPKTWDLVRRRRPEIGPYEPNWRDPYQSSLAAAELMRINRGELERRGINLIDGPVLYMAHQQGAAGYVELATAGRGAIPNTNLVSAEAMRGNPPPDKRGVTTNRKEFFDRWMAYLQTKFAR